MAKLSVSPYCVWYYDETGQWAGSVAYGGCHDCGQHPNPYPPPHPGSYVIAPCKSYAGLPVINMHIPCGWTVRLTGYTKRPPKKKKTPARSRKVRA